MSSGQRLLVELRRARNAFIVQAPFEGKSRKTNCLAAWGTFCKRKSSQQTSDSHNPEKPPGGRFFYCRRINCVSGKQRSAFSAVRPGNSAAHSPPLLPRGGTAQRIPPHPIYPFKHQKGAACQPAGCSFSVVSNYDFSGWKAGSAPSRSPASAGPQR